MSDFDFDEIDRAVAGVIGDDQSFNASSARPEINSAPAEPVAQEAPRSQAPAGPPATRRSSGRFMDVVHPSSDMRTKNASFTPPVPRTADSTEKVSEEAKNEADDTWSQPLESPFLPDAKVEKRPLGAFALETAPLALEEPEEELLLEAPDEPRIEAHVMPDPIDFAAHSNALPSESEDTGAPVVTESASEEELVYEEASIETPQENTPVAQEAPRPDVVTVEESREESAGPASITQQYTEQPSSAPSSGAIYDTENYHKPLTPVEKKHSGVWVALGIILLVVLGAGAGVAFYMFVLPML